MLTRLFPFLATERFLPVRQFIRRNFLTTVTSFIFLASFALVVIQVDSAYKAQKKELVNNLISSGEIFGADEGRQKLSDAVARYLNDLSRASTLNPRVKPPPEKLLDEVKSLMRQVFEQNPMIHAMALRAPNGDPIYEIADPSRIGEQNDFSNSLIRRDFSTRLISGKSDSERGQTLGTLEFQFTTPRGIPAIEELTRKWWTRLGLISVVVIGLYCTLMWFVIWPVRSLIEALDKGPKWGAPLVSNPRTLLLKYYNNLARDANLSLFSRRLREFVSERALLDPVPLLGFIPQEAKELFPITEAHVLLFRQMEEEEGWTLEETISSAGAAPCRGDAVAVMNHLLSMASETDGKTPRGETLARGGGEREVLEVLGLFEGMSAGLVVVPEKAPHGDHGPWLDDLCARMAQEARYVLRALAGQRRLVLQEKSKANISLSRNLGHDLTNIIATSKLDLMAVKTFLDAPADAIRSSPVKEKIFRESLASLLNNTKFLQEIVNLYRSFTYLSRPRFERVEINDMVNDVARLFQLSLSRSFAIRVELAEGLPPVQVEPRLLRLALFNLLSNAAESIKRASSYENPNGEIVLATTLQESNGAIEIVVADSGTGICGPDGELLSSREIEEIFRLGYSTKDKEDGEGLGLHWVRQIIREFHHGTIRPRNRSDEEGGGAAFHIWLPIDAETAGLAPSERIEDSRPHPPLVPESPAVP
ncbi:MAG: ATP-binding protein [Sumerlaeia bacterium]